MLHCGEFGRFSPKEHFFLRLYIGKKGTYTLAYVPVPKLPECQLHNYLIVQDLVGIQVVRPESAARRAVGAQNGLIADSRNSGSPRASPIRRPSEHSRSRQI